MTSRAALQVVTAMSHDIIRSTATMRNPNLKTTITIGMLKVQLRGKLSGSFHNLEIQAETDF